MNTVSSRSVHSSSLIAHRCIIRWPLPLREATDRGFLAKGKSRAAHDVAKAALLARNDKKTKKRKIDVVEEADESADVVEETPVSEEEEVVADEADKTQLMEEVEDEDAEAEESPEEEDQSGEGEVEVEAEEEEDEEEEEEAPAPAKKAKVQLVKSISVVSNWLLLRSTAHQSWNHGCHLEGGEGAWFCCFCKCW